MIKPLPIGNGTNLDIDQTSAHDGVGVIYYNCYQDRAGSIRTIPGLDEYDDTATGTGKNVYEYFSKTFGVRLTVSNGRMWAQHSKGGARTEVTGGALTAGLKPAFCEDTNNIFVAANSPIYKIDLSAHTMTAITAGVGQTTKLPPTTVTTLAFISGYMLANGDEIAGDTVYSDHADTITGLVDYAEWEVYNSEVRSDPLQTIIITDNQWVHNIGTETLEVTYVSTDPANPFPINKGRLSSFGTLAKYSPAYDGQSLYYLSEITNSRKIVANTGGTVEIISFPLDIPLEDFERVDDAEGWIMAFKGQNFYVLHFPTANATINEQTMASITVAWHIQKKCWVIFARWDVVNGEWLAYRGNCFQFIEPWNLRLVGDRSSGKTYQLYEDATIDYSANRVFQHRWRDDNLKDWAVPRTDMLISLGVTGGYKRPADQYMCGQYLNRQHEISYSDLTDAGETFRAMIVSGNINHQIDTHKRANFYRYNCKTGTNEFIINSISEDVTPLAR